MDAKSNAQHLEPSAQKSRNLSIESVTSTTLTLPGKRAGKVRDVYDLSAPVGACPRILVVATDRISAFDVVLPSAIAEKGKLLTEISVRWFERIREWKIIADHLISTDPTLVADISTQERDMLRGRCMICRKVKIVPIECVVRGWLAGSAHT